MKFGEDRVKRSLRYLAKALIFLNEIIYLCRRRLVLNSDVCQVPTGR